MHFAQALRGWKKPFSGSFRSSLIPKEYVTTNRLSDRVVTEVRSLERKTTRARRLQQPSLSFRPGVQLCTEFRTQLREDGYQRRRLCSLFVNHEWSPNE